MGKRKSWFDKFKRFFSLDDKAKQDKRDRRRMWICGRLKQGYQPALPPPTSVRERTLKEAEEEQNKHAMAVAVATAAAAEAAVAAAQAAAQVVRLTGTPLSYFRTQAAAVMIQSAFRGYLARRALRALKGLVMLQALIRGQAVRHQTNIALRNLQSLMKIQSHAHASRLRTVEDPQTYEEDNYIYRKLNEPEDLKNKLHQNSGKRWDGSVLSMEEINSILKNKRDAALKRERAMQYASYYQERRNPRRPSTPVAEEYELEDAEHRWSWLEQWMGTQAYEKDIPEVLPTPSPVYNAFNERDRVPTSLHGSNFMQREKSETPQLRSAARRSFNRSRRNTARDDCSYTSSPSVPSYMASTASANARFRSLSTPKQRVRTTDTFSDHCIPYSTRLLSPFPAVTSDVGFTRSNKFHHNHKSPRWKAQTTPVVKSYRSSNYHSIDSQCSFLNWDRRSAFR